MGGKARARHVIEMLNAELELAMAVCGCRSAREIIRVHVQTESDQIRALLSSLQKSMRTRPDAPLLLKLMMD
jgi:hypothetical protein